MSTLNTFGFPYCTPALFVERYDVRTVGDYLSDTDIRLTPVQVLASPILLDFLRSGSATVESRALMGERYSVADLQLIANMDNSGVVQANAGNAAHLLYKIVAGLAMFDIWNRRPSKMAKDQMPASCEEAYAYIEAIGKGQQIFGILEVAAAPNAPPEFMTRADIFKRNFSSNQAKRFFGDRAQYQVPGCG